MDYIQTPTTEVNSTGFDLSKESGLKLFEKGSTVADLLFGSFAGMLGKLIEYPLDTVKVRLQSQPAGQRMFEGPWDCLRKTVHHEGFHGLYRGLSSPLVGAMLENSALFVGYAQGQKLIRKFLRGEHDLEDKGALPELSLSELCLAGGFSGIAATFVLTPIELIKCKLQVQEARKYQNSVLRGSQVTHFTGPFSVISHTLKHEGITGFYRGNLPTLFREVGGGAAWFGVYEAICRWLIARESKNLKSGEIITKSNLGAGHLMLAGAVAGMSYNFILFPADVIKSQMQTEVVGQSQYTSQFKRGIIQIAKELYAAEGIRGFYRGCGITVAKSAPTSAIIFFTHETLTRHFT
ncbi:mitochondrial ornithine carrier protein [Basidiobolus ranarum]|uniref:Mitochondrial ornithine carrier protein n=1 Tax=Basidiobolus ranarum TaxID=34480 RepID=A0ABR2VV87_9FUNG